MSTFTNFRDFDVVLDRNELQLPGLRVKPGDSFDGNNYFKKFCSTEDTIPGTAESIDSVLVCDVDDSPAYVSQVWRNLYEDAP